MEDNAATSFVRAEGRRRPSRRRRPSGREVLLLEDNDPFGHEKQQPQRGNGESLAREILDILPVEGYKDCMLSDPPHKGGGETLSN
jgi:hypothetical protein